MKQTWKNQGTTVFFVLSLSPPQGCESPEDRTCFTHLLKLFIYLCSAVLGLRCCMGCSLVVLCRLLIAVASHNGVLALGHAGFSSWGIEAQQLWFPGSRAQAQCCGTRASLLHSMWDLPRSGMELVSPALTGGLFTTGPPGKPCFFGQRIIWSCNRLPCPSWIFSSSYQVDATFPSLLTWLSEFSSRLNLSASHIHLILKMLIINLLCVRDCDIN